MTTTTQITNIAHLLDLADYAGDFLADYDMDAIRSDFIDEIQARLPSGVTLLGNGEVIADIDVDDQARELDWDEILEDIDVAPIFERHDLTSRIQLDYDADGFGQVVRKVHDTAGNVLIAWGPTPATRTATSSTRSATSTGSAPTTTTTTRDRRSPVPAPRCSPGRWI
jgi:hypothetical protein